MNPLYPLFADYLCSSFNPPRDDFRCLYMVDFDIYHAQTNSDCRIYLL